MTAQPAGSALPSDFNRWDRARIITLIQDLVCIPTRGGMDDYRPAVDMVTERLIESVRQPVQILGTQDEPLGIAVTIPGTDPDGPHYVLDAPLDTAGIGDRNAWDRDPFSGDLEDGWLHGRGAADAKAAVAIFTHLAGRLVRERLRGTLTLLFDLDEHTGGFGGIKAWLASQQRKPDGVMIGYPGPHKIVIGGRGVWRGRIIVHGRAVHSGASGVGGVNAISRAASVVHSLNWEIPHDIDADLGLRPQINVTAIRGGAEGAFSVVPDRAEMEVDVRLTTSFTAADAEAWVRETVAGAVWREAERCPTIVTPVGEPWPAYRLPADHHMVQTLRSGARLAGLDPTPTVAGPSNIGCLLSQHGIPATAGFGVAYRGLHAANEAIDVSTIPAVYVAYYEAVRRLLG